MKVMNKLRRLVKYKIYYTALLVHCCMNIERYRQARGSISAAVGFVRSVRASGLMSQAAAPKEATLHEKKNSMTEDKLEHHEVDK